MTVPCPLLVPLLPSPSVSSGVEGSRDTSRGPNGTPVNRGAHGRPRLDLRDTAARAHLAAGHCDPTRIPVGSAGAERRQNRV